MNLDTIITAVAGAAVGLLVNQNSRAISRLFAKVEKLEESVTVLKTRSDVDVVLKRLGKS